MNNNTMALAEAKRNEVLSEAGTLTEGEDIHYLRYIAAGCERVFFLAEDSVCRALKIENEKLATSLREALAKHDQLSERNMELEAGITHIDAGGILFCGTCMRPI